MERKYEEKEIAIFNGVIQLIKDGVEVHHMKASDIAATANIGKGTLYNYFKTKEEIIAKAMVYMMEVEFFETVELVTKAEGFKNKFYAILDSIEGSVESTNSTLNWIISNMQGKNLIQYINEDVNLKVNLKTQIFEAMRLLCTLGVEEKIIKPQQDKEYEYTVFASVFLGYSNSFCSIGGNKIISGQKAKDNAYKLLLKALN